jgi:hypothetical protein
MPIRYVAVFCVCLASAGHAQTLTLPIQKRPEWLGRDGIVMAGSWEPLPFRVRRDGAAGYTPTAEQRKDYLREHSPEMVARLKALGVNFVMMHCYKGGGLEAERQSMADAVRFARLSHEAGLHVGVYNYSGAFIWELFFKEHPEAKDWVVRNADGSPKTYGRATYRYYWNRNHPDAQAFYRRLVRFAVEDIRADLLHFDNYVVGPGYDANSVARFRDYLRKTFSPQRLRESGIGDPGAAQPPGGASPPLLRYAWSEFSCRSLADSYFAMGRYARPLRPDILLECNCGGVGSRIHPPVDHGRLLRGGEAFWDESGRSGYSHGTLRSHIRTFKVARAMHNVAFAYSTTPLEMAEAMAFNRDCLGAICWFEYGRITNRPGSKESVAEEIRPFVRFFHKRRDLLRGARVVADVAVLRSFPSEVFAGATTAQLPYKVEEALIRNRQSFQIIYDHQLADLGRYRVLVLAGCVALSDAQIGEIRRWAGGGGRVCVIGPLATHDEWMVPRAKPALDDLPEARTVRIAAGGDVLEAVRRSCQGKLSLSVEPQPKPGEPKPRRADGLCAELTEQPGRRMVHLVNYRSDGPIEDVAVRVRLPAGQEAKSVVLASPEHERDLPAPFRQEAGTVSFTVPKVNVYEIAVLNVQ